MSCCRNGFFAGIFAGRRNMTVILTFDPQFTAKEPLQLHDITSQQKRNHSSDEHFSSLNTKQEPTVNFDCKKCLKLIRFLEKEHCTVPRTIARICQTKSASRYFSFASSHDTPCASIHPRIQSSHPTKHVNSDRVRV